MARVIVVDDDRDLRDILCDILRDAGHDASDASGLRDLLRAIRCGPRPDVVLLDVMMPGTDGLGVLQVLRRRPEWSVPVVMLTALESAPHRAAARALGAVDYLVKPPTIPRLLDAVESAVRGRRAVRP